MKKVPQKPKDNQVISILKHISKRVEESTIDIHKMRIDLKSLDVRLGIVEDNTEIMKVDMEKMREQLAELDTRLNKRITRVSDLITLEFGGKLQNHEKRIKILEKNQATS